MYRSLSQILSEDCKNIGICSDKFEPMQPEKLPRIYTVSGVQLETVMREAMNCNGVFAAGMFRALELLGLPS